MSSAYEGVESGSSGASRAVKKTERNRRSWTANEEATLVACLKELIAQGQKSDNGFRAGYLKKLEEAMKGLIPDTDLKGIPHINSKICIWKKNYYSLTEILSRSGVGFNVNGNHKIECEDEQWEQIIKCDPNARVIRYKSWPLYDDWKEIFGKDRATGDTAEDIMDAYNNLCKEGNTRNDDIGPDYEVNVEDINESEGAADSASQSQRPSGMSDGKRKKLKMSEEMAAVCDILEELGRKTDSRLAQMVDRIGYEFELGKKRGEAFEKLGGIPDLSLEDRFHVCELLSAKRDKLEVFVGMPIAARADYVMHLLKFKDK